MLGVEVRSSRWVLVAGMAVAACGSSKGDAVGASAASGAAGAAPDAATGGKSSSSGGSPTAGARAGGGASVAGAEVDTGGTASDGGSDSSGGGVPGQAGQASSMGGEAGSSNTTTGQRCAPGVLIQNPYGSVAGNCYYWEQSHRGIPNIDNTSVRYIHLPAPTTPGKPYAVSMGMAGAGIDETVELWGSDAQCGNAQELLWWGQLRAGEICAEFEPTQSFSNLLMVWRPLWSKSANAEHDTLTFCPTGSWRHRPRTARASVLMAPLSMRRSARSFSVQASLRARSTSTPRLATAGCTSKVTRRFPSAPRSPSTPVIFACKRAKVSTTPGTAPAPAQA